MARWGLTVIALVATAALVGGVSAASGNEPPLADAGLDQTVDNGTTVYLDAGGSIDPDGTIATVRWTVTDPDGASVTTADATSARTSFTPAQTGTYTVNLSVTDDDGATADDTLYVTVEERDGPAVTLVGPGQAAEGEETEFTVSSTAGDADLRQLYWMENGSNERTVDLSGDESTVTLNRSFSDPGPVRLQATVLDTKGYSGTSSIDIQVLSPSGGGTYDHCPGGGSPYFVEGEFIGCNDGGADMIFEDRVLEANSEPGLWVYSQEAGEVVQMATEEEVEEMMGESNGALTREEVAENYEETLQNRQRPIFDINNPRGGRYQDSTNRARSANDPSSPRNNAESSNAPSPPVDSTNRSPSPSPSPTFP